ncbi:MAG TPA: sulfotransferase [Solimonas sp.]|nr:sulfotransferase [Solimonas sp.]
MQPNLFLVGAPKCGTTALYSYLAQHPDVYCSPLVKEFNHFNQDLMHGRTGVVSREEYLSYFAGAGSKRYAVDGSVWYLYSERAAAEIKAFAPDARLVVTLRDPVEQVASMHSQRLSTGYENIADLGEALDAEADRREGRRVPVGAYEPRSLLYRDIASYAAQLQRYLDLFPPQQVHVMLYEAFRADPEREYRRLLEFLGLEPVMPADFAVVNPNKSPRVRALPRLARYVRELGWLRRAVRRLLPTAGQRIRLSRWVYRMNSRVERRASMSPVLASGLRQTFAPDVVRLEALLGQKLPWPQDPPKSGRIAS